MRFELSREQYVESELSDSRKQLITTTVNSCLPYQLIVRYQLIVFFLYIFSAFIFKSHLPKSVLVQHYQCCFAEKHFNEKDKYVTCVGCVCRGGGTQAVPNLLPNLYKRSLDIGSLTEFPEISQIRTPPPPPKKKKKKKTKKTNKKNNNNKTNTHTHTHTHTHNNLLDFWESNSTTYSY